MIIADNREGIDHPFEETTLPAGDYVVETDTDHPGFLVERKSFSDFVGSYRSGKMFTQIEMIQSQDHIPILLLEGSRSPAIRHANASRGEIRRALTSILVKSDLRMIRAANPRESVDIIMDLDDWIGGESGGHSVREVEKVSAEDRPQYIVEGLPGVGPKTAGNLLAHFTSVRAVMTASIDELQNVPGVGPKTAEKITAAVTR